MTTEETAVRPDSDFESPAQPGATHPCSAELRASQPVRRRSSRGGSGRLRAVGLALVTSAALAGAGVVADEGFELTRTATGKPDLTGFYDGSSLTPLNRPEQFGERRYMTAAEADAFVNQRTAWLDAFNRESDPDRGPPVKGGDGNNTAGAGGVGGYNAFYVDPGDAVDMIDGKYPTSIIYDPPNGRQPPMTAAARAQAAENSSSFRHDNDGTASWLASGGHGPFDGPEDLALSERCLLGFTSGTPSLPSLYNNFRRIIQTETHVMILLEMVHDARVIRIGGEHGPPDQRRWLGDSVGHWEGDTLVVDTTNFRDRSALMGADANLHVVERFTALPDGNILYDFTVEDPTAWTAPWSGQFIWKRSSERLYEYACHEANYAMGNILRGARLLEKEWLEEHGDPASPASSQESGGR